MKAYKLVDLGTFDGVAPWASAINDAGIVVGSLDSAAMRYDGKLHPLLQPPGTLQATANSIANRSPELIAGFRLVSVDPKRASVPWRPSGRTGNSSTSTRN